MKKIVLIPVFNEKDNIGDVLSQCEDKIDIFVVINDGSTDGSKEILDAWARHRPDAYVIHGDRNRGMSWAVKEGFRFIEGNRHRLGLSDKDIVVQMDADAQHSMDELPALLGYMIQHDVDCLITRRRLDGYPLIKVFGNYMMSLLGSLMAWKRFYDIESGYRMIRVGAVPAVLFYMVGYKYSWAQEMAIISSWLGLKIDNRQETAVLYYRKRGTRMIDAVINCLCSCLFLPLNYCFKGMISGHMCPKDREKMFSADSG